MSYFTSHRDLLHSFGEESAKIKVEILCRLKEQFNLNFIQTLEFIPKKKWASILNDYFTEPRYFCKLFNSCSKDLHSDDSQMKMNERIHYTMLLHLLPASLFGLITIHKIPFERIILFLSYSGFCQFRLETNIPSPFSLAKCLVNQTDKNGFNYILISLLDNLYIFCSEAKGDTYHNVFSWLSVLSEEMSQHEGQMPINKKIMEIISMYDTKTVPLTISYRVQQKLSKKIPFILYSYAEKGNILDAIDKFEEAINSKKLYAMIKPLLENEEGICHLISLSDNHIALLQDYHNECFYVHMKSAIILFRFIYVVFAHEKSKEFLQYVCVILRRTFTAIFESKITLVGISFLQRCLSSIEQKLDTNTKLYLTHVLFVYLHIIAPNNDNCTVEMKMLSNTYMLSPRIIGLIEQHLTNEELLTNIQHYYFLNITYGNEEFDNLLKTNIKQAEQLKKINLDWESKLSRIESDLSKYKYCIEPQLLLLEDLKNLLLEIHGKKFNIKKEVKVVFKQIYKKLLGWIEHYELKRVEKGDRKNVLSLKYNGLCNIFGILGAYRAEKMSDIKIDSKTINLDYKIEVSSLCRYLQNYLGESEICVRIPYSEILKYKAQLHQKLKKSKIIEMSQNLTEKIDVGPIVSGNLVFAGWITSICKNIKNQYSDILEICSRIMYRSVDFTFEMMPLVIFHFLNTCADSTFPPILWENFNIIFKQKKIFPIKACIKSLSMLDEWHKEIEFDKLSNKSNSYDIFLKNYPKFKEYIDCDTWMHAQYYTEDFKGMLKNMEKKYSLKIVTKEGFNLKTKEDFLLTYNALCNLSGDLRNIQFYTIVKKLFNIEIENDVSDSLSYLLSNESMVMIQSDLKIFFAELATTFRLSTDSLKKCKAYYNYIFSSYNVINDTSISLTFILLFYFLQKISNIESNYLKVHLQSIQSLVSNAKMSIAFLLSNNTFDRIYALVYYLELLVNFENLLVCLNPEIFKNNRLCKIGLDLKVKQATSMIVEGKIMIDEGNGFQKIQKIIDKVDNYEFTSQYLTILLSTAFISTEIESNKTNGNNAINYQIVHELLYTCIKYHYDNNRLSEAHRISLIFMERISFFQQNNANTLILVAKILRKMETPMAGITVLEMVRNNKLQEVRAKIMIAKCKLGFYSFEHANEYFKSQILDIYSKTCSSEEMYFKYAQMLDESNQTPDPPTCERIVRYYLESTKHGCKYLYQSLPRAIRIWMEFSANIYTSSVTAKGVYAALDQSPLKQNEKNLQYEILSKMNHKVLETIKNAKEWSLLPILQLFISRVDHPDPEVHKIIVVGLSKIASKFPLQSIWWLLPLKYFDFKIDRELEKTSKTRLSQEILDTVKKENPKSYQHICGSEVFIKTLIEFGSSTEMKIPPKLLTENHSSKNILLPIQKYLSPKLPGVKDNSGNFNPYNSHPQFINCIDARVEIIHSKERPKKIVFITADQKKYTFLLKFEPLGDVRKESRTIEFANFLNLILKSNKQTRIRKFRLKTYAITSLMRNVNLVEWIDDSETVKTIVERLWTKNGLSGTLRDIDSKYKITDQKIPLKAWEEQKNVPSVLQEVFLNETNNDLWYQKLLAYNKSSALWSLFCYIIGLGDRHCDNILLQKTTGEIIHIDFDCIFDKGKYLGIPELLSFRLTKNIEGAMGIFKSFGLFRYYLYLLSKVFNKNINNILGALDSFLYDPLIEHKKALHFKSKHTFECIKQKILEMDHRKSMEQTVDKLIDYNRSQECFKQMFHGWMAHM